MLYQDACVPQNRPAALEEHKMEEDESKEDEEEPGAPFLPEIGPSHIVSVARSQVSKSVLAMHSFQQYGRATGELAHCLSTRTLPPS